MWTNLPLAWILPALIALILIPAYSTNEFKAEDDDDGSLSGTRWLFSRIGSQPEILQPLISHLEQQGINVQTDIPQPNSDTSALCFGCWLALEAIKGALILNMDYDSLSVYLLPICRWALPGGPRICKGFLDNYGPHVAYIVNVTRQEKQRKSSLEACQQMNHCKLQIDDSSFSSNGLIFNNVANPGRSDTFGTWHPDVDLISKTLAESSNGGEHIGRKDARRRQHARVKRHADRKKDAIKVLQLADFHIDEKYTEENATAAGHWGSYGLCNVPPRTVTHFLKFAADELKPDFAIYSGDNPPHAAWEESYESQIHVTELAGRLVKEGLWDKHKIRTYPAIGNHETNPTNLFTMDKTIHLGRMRDFNEKWEAAWADSANFQSEQKRTIHNAGYYTIPVETVPGLRIVCLNSNYGYIDNFYNLIQWEQDEYKEMMEWFKRTLAEARNANEHVIVVTHHEIGSNMIDFDTNLTRILVQYRDIIVFHPVGHTHRDEFRLYFDEKEKELAGMVHVSMTMGTWPYVNPGFRLYYLDKDDHTVLDYDQYYVNIQNATKDTIPTKLYTFTEAYGVPNATARGHMELNQKLRADDKLMEKYWYNRRLATGKDGPITPLEKAKELCRQVSQTYKIYLQCEQKYLPTIAPPTEPDTSPIIETSTGSNTDERSTVWNPSDTTPTITKTSTGSHTEEWTTTVGNSNAASGSLYNRELFVISLALTLLNLLKEERVP